MKKHFYLVSVFAIALSCSAIAQDNPKQNKNSGKKSEIVFSSQKEKDVKIQELEAKIKINLSDPTYPKDELTKQQEELKQIKSAKITNSTSK